MTDSLVKPNVSSHLSRSKQINRNRGDLQHKPRSLFGNKSYIFQNHMLLEREHKLQHQLVSFKQVPVALREWCKAFSK